MKEENTNIGISDIVRESSNILKEDQGKKVKKGKEEET